MPTQVRILPDAQQTNEPDVKTSGDFVCASGRIRKTERGTQSVDWVASCGHDKNFRRKFLVAEEKRTRGPARRKNFAPFFQKLLSSAIVR